MKKIRLGICGTGWPGQQHAKALLTSEQGRLYACADLAAERRAAFAAEFSPDESFADYQEMLADPQVDAVVICLPNFLHFPATMAALVAGKHVLCEKPPTLNSVEIKLLQEEASKRGLIYFFSRQSRFSPAMRVARKLIHEGRLGSVYFARATWVRSRGTPVGIDAWFTDKSRSGGGALIDIGIHALDAVWFLMGTPRPVSVTAAIFQNFAHLVKAPVFDVEDSAYAFIRFENGAVVHLETSWAANLTDDIPDGGWTGLEMVGSTLYGTKATVRLNPLTLFEDQDGELVTVPIEASPAGNEFELQMQNFLDAIIGVAAPANDARQAVQLMEMLDAIYESSEIKREVRLA